MHPSQPGLRRGAATSRCQPKGASCGYGEVWAIRAALLTSGSVGYHGAAWSRSRRGSFFLRFPRLWVGGGAAIVVALALVLAVTAATGRFPFSHHQASRAAAAARSAASRASGQAAPGSHSATVGSGGAAAQAAGAGPAAVIAKLSARQLAGQRVIYSYSGLTPPASLLYLIRRGEAAGVIFFSGNVSSLAQIAVVTSALERANASTLNPVRLPLLLMTDQEGGTVRRLPGAPYLSEKEIGQSASPAAQASIAGGGAAANLRGAGLNVNLAPVLDVYRTAGNFIDQYGRSYSSSAPSVNALGADFIMAQQGGGVAATAKHFPGLGAAATSQDTDVEPVTLNLPASEIRSIDEEPYKAAISAGVKLVMASWAVYPSLDRSRPAGLSSVIVQGELRKRLGFRGVTITDALEAGALHAFGTIGNRSQLAAQAGMDLLLCAGQTASEGEQALDALEGGYRDGHLSQSAFRASVTRILDLRAALPR
jgi:beta-N-acetylhexosaminidase